MVYSSTISSDESHSKTAENEELVHATIISLLHSKDYNYPLNALGHEIYFAHGSKGSKSDEVDVLIKDSDGMPYAMFEIKPSKDFDKEKDDAIKNQLFGTAPLVGAPKLLVYATVEPKGSTPKMKAICIDYTKHKSYSAWKDESEPQSSHFPNDYQDLDYKPYVNEGSNDLDLNCTQSDFRQVALTFHNEFFGEHADNTIFVNLVKCLLAKIYDERTCTKGDEYKFQVFQRNGKPDSSKQVFKTVNELYKTAYKRYIDSQAVDIDEINPKEFSEERVKTVVLALQGISITKGAAKHGDIIGAFFEEILRTGFKQDRGMYFTHDNIVKFMVEAVGLEELTKSIWMKSTHPDNRLPYVMDPACGSGTFLLHVMNAITSTIKREKKSLVTDHDSDQFYNARLSDSQPNYWAENFIYGFDPKFIMAITAKVNMVLHGDGSAHIAKEDAFKPFSLYSDPRLRPSSDSARSIQKSQYNYNMCESFDLVISNPPFGITLASDVRNKVDSTFSLPSTTPSEGLFLERCFQLLKPQGRLAVVVPESLLNSKEMIDARLFLYRFFKVQAIVSLPRNVFIDTPTLTSLVFAKKKTAAEITQWDNEWEKAQGAAEHKIKISLQALSKINCSQKSGVEVAEAFMSSLMPLATKTDWILKGGKSPSVLPFWKNWEEVSSADVAAHYKEITRTSGFDNLKTSFIFKSVAKNLDYNFPVFMVEEVGYKLSKRKEKAKPNHLCVFRGTASNTEYCNLHLMEEDYEVIVDTDNPVSTLDFIRKNVSWI